MRITRRRLLLVLAVLVVVLNWTWGRLPAEPPPPAGSRYAVVDGVRVHYMETPGRGPGVIMVHGHPGTFLDWSRVRARMPGVRTVAIDRPGYGYSSGGYVPFERQVSIVHGLAARLGMRRPVIAGHSYGGSIALAYAGRYPRSTRAVVAVDPAFDTDVLDRLQMLQARSIKLLGLPIVQPVANATFSQLMLTGLSNPQAARAFAPDAVPDAYLRQLRSVNLKPSDLATFADETLAFRKDVGPATARFSELRTPAWIVQGKGDRLVPTASVVRGASQVAGVHLVLLGGGHMQPWVHPRVVARAIEAASQ
jgi:pimeloyl-ACP methyl ester carboxylesterase